MRRLLTSLICAVAIHATAQTPVAIQVDLSKPVGAYKPIYSWFAAFAGPDPQGGCAPGAGHRRLGDQGGARGSGDAAMGSPQNPTAEQCAKLKAAGDLELLHSPEWLEVEGARSPSRPNSPARQPR
jgi:hypothetical protein